jgi:hypothetical protein
VTSTVAAGTVASYNLALTLAPTAGTVTFTCTGLPRGAACSFSPASLTASGSDVVSISTTSRADSVPVAFRVTPPWPPITGLFLATLGILTACLLSRQTLKRRLGFVASGVLIISLVFGCGGGTTQPPVPTPAATATPTPTPNPNGTPVGTYVVTVSATGATAPATQVVTLVVN